MPAEENLSTEQRKEAARTWIKRGFNEKDLNAFDDYFGPGLLNHDLPPGLPAGVEGTKTFASMFLAAFPDIRVSVDDQVGEGDRLVTRWSAVGTHQGELLGIPATGKRINITGIGIDRFEDEKSVEHWELFDQLGLMRQLGAIPEREQVAA